MAKTVLITGASAGIGLELARIYAESKHDLILSARRIDRLQSVADELSGKHGIKASVCAADLANANAPARLQKYTEDNGLSVDILVNNAGFGASGKFSELDTQRQLDMMQVNVMSLVHLTRLYLPGMVSRKSGGILNVASTAAFIPGPLMAVYYATKAFVLSFSEALADEVSGTGVSVCCLCPGATITEFQAIANIEKSKLFNGPHVMDAMTVARMGYDGLRNNETVVVCGLRNQIAVAASKFVPRSVTNSIARKVAESS